MQSEVESINGTRPNQETEEAKSFQESRKQLKETKIDNLTAELRATMLENALEPNLQNDA